MKLRRHANRRWFDLGQRKYVEPSMVMKALRRGESVEARDARSGADRTSELLLAVLASEIEAGRVPAKDEFLRLILSCGARKPESQKRRDVMAELDKLLGDSDS